jgi:hypothetical protein
VAGLVSRGDEAGGVSQGAPPVTSEVDGVLPSPGALSVASAAGSTPPVCARQHTRHNEFPHGLRNLHRAGVPVCHLERQQAGDLVACDRA